MESLPLVLRVLSENTVYSLYSLSPLESEEFRDSCTRKQWNEQYLQSLTPWFRSADGRCLARLTRKRSPQDATGVGIVNTITRESNMPDQLQQWKKAEIDTNDPFIGYMTNEQVCYMMYNFIAPSSRIIQDRPFIMQTRVPKTSFVR